jgi:hypothetical protein
MSHINENDNLKRLVVNTEMYDREFHTAIENEEQPFMARLADYISRCMKPQALIDFGCSSGVLLREVKRVMPDIESVGYEFSDAAVQHALCSDVIQFDLTKPLERERRPNTLGVCLEVLEHIDDSHWETVLQNITKYCDRILFSAAFPNQPGVGHINCRMKIDWIRRFHSLGWVVDHDQTMWMMEDIRNGYHMGWFLYNAIVLVPA